jgi:hypothetical protein
MQYVSVRSLLAVALLTLAACAAGNGEGLDANGLPNGAEPPPDQTLTATFASIQANIFTPICTRCHSGPAAPQGLQLDAQHSYALLVGVPSTESPALLRVKPGDPDSSYIVQKLEGAPGIVGARMPFGGPYLSQSTIDIIRQWITDGAQNDAAAAATDAPFAVAATSPPDGAHTHQATGELVIAFNHEVDFSLLNETTVALERTDAPQSEPARLAFALASGNPRAVRVTLPAALAPGSYRVTVRGTGGAALADVNAQPLGRDYSYEFTVDTVP